MLIAKVAVTGLAVVAGFFTPVHAQDARDQFFTHLKDLCGARFEGKMTFPADGQHDFAGKLLVAHVASCGDQEIRVPFLVGEDRSRMWIFTRSAAGLQLKHDHRHADGTPDEVTMYGGMASATGTPLAQSFAADAHTARLIPAAATNVWTVSLSADGKSLTYHLDRDAKPRFTAVLARTETRPGDAAPAEVVTKFYSAYQGMERGGLPRPEDQAKLDPLLTPRLRSLLAEARRGQAEEARRFPDEKPPFADGDLFSSLFEGFQSFSVGKVEALPDGGYRVEVHFTFEETRWKDAVLLVQHEGALLIDDFVFLGDWPFAQKGRLSEQLRAECH